MFAASRRSGVRSRPTDSNENSLGTPANPLPTRSQRSSLLAIQDPSRNPRGIQAGSATSDPKKDLGDILIKAPRSVQSLTAWRSPGVSHGNGVHTALVRERGCSFRGLRAAEEVRSSGPVDVQYDEPSFWNDHKVQTNSSYDRSVSSATGRPVRLAPIARARINAEVEEKTSQRMADALESKIERGMKAQREEEERKWITRGFARAALSQSVARSSRGSAFLLPVRFRDAVLIDPSKLASAGACGKLKHSVSRCSVMFRESMPPTKEELTDFSVAQNMSFLSVEGFGVGGIVWANSLKKLLAEDTPLNKIAEVVQSGDAEETLEMNQDHPTEDMNLLYQAGRRKTEDMSRLHQAVSYPQERFVPSANSQASNSLGGPVV